MADRKIVIPFEELRREDVALVGGKNSSLGEMVQELGSVGINVPPGFATTADAFRDFILSNDLNTKIAGLLENFETGKRSLHKLGEEVRSAIASGDWPAATENAIRLVYR